MAALNAKSTGKASTKKIEKTEEVVADIEEVKEDAPIEDEAEGSVSVETKEKAPSVVLDTTENEQAKAKTVKVKTKIPYKCCIGKVRYSFEPDKVYYVPVNVKLILTRADVLMPL